MDIEIEITDTHLAFDRRSYDADGRLTVTDCVISAAQVNPYLGREIPNADALGLDPERVYNLYRDATALRAAVPLFNGKPLLIDHAPVTAADPKQQLVVGTVRDCRWSNGEVVGTVDVWDASAIRGVESNLKRDLSAGYHYTCNMTPGVTPKGDSYDGRMVSIQPNHVALVVEGRVLGAQVGDSALDRRATLETLIPGYYRLR